VRDVSPENDSIDAGTRHTDSALELIKRRTTIGSLSKGQSTSQDGETRLMILAAVRGRPNGEITAHELDVITK